MRHVQILFVMMLLVIGALLPTAGAWSWNDDPRHIPSGYPTMKERNLFTQRSVQPPLKLNPIHQKTWAYNWREDVVNRAYLPVRDIRHQEELKRRGLQKEQVIPLLPPVGISKNPMAWNQQMAEPGQTSY